MRKHLLLWSTALLLAAAVQGAPLKLLDFSKFKTSGSVQCGKKNGIAHLQGNIQGGEIRMVISAARLKGCKFLTVDRRYQSGEWSIWFAEGLERTEIKPQNPGDIKVNFPITSAMQKKSKEWTFVLKLEPEVELELGGITFAPNAAQSEKYVQRVAKGPLRILETPVGKFTIPAIYEDTTPKIRRENVKFTLDANDSGLRSYVVDNLLELNPKLRPSQAEFDRHIVMFGAPGQYEGAAFSLYAVKNAPKTLVTVAAPAAADGSKLPVPEVRYLRVWPQRDHFVGLKYRDVAELLEVEVPKDIAADTALAYYLKVRIPDDAKPGLYKGKISYKSGDSAVRTLDYSVRVLALTLDKEFSPVIGCYYGSPSQFKMIRSYGLNSALQGHQNCMRDVLKKPMTEIMRKEKNVQKRLEMLYRGKNLPQLNFEDSRPNGMDNFLKAYKEAGFKSVVCWICVGGFTDIMAKFLDLPISKERNLGQYPAKLTPEYRKLFKDCIRAIDERAAKFGVRIYWYQFDELGCHGSKTSFLYATEMFKLVKEAGGFTAITCGDDEFTDMVAPWLDMRIYGWSSAKDKKQMEKIRKDTAKYKAQLFSYGGSTYEQHYRNRFYAGFNMWLGGWEGRYFWNLSSRRGNIWNDFDHKQKDCVMIYPAPDGGILPTLQLDMLRQGIDDFRYLVTVEKLAAKAVKSSDTAVRNAGVQVQQELEFIRKNTPLYFQSDWDIRNFERLRWRVATLGEYLQALMEKKAAVPQVKFFGAAAQKKNEVNYPVMLNVPRITKPITVDGDLSDEEWRNAAVVPELHYETGRKPDVPTVIKLALDDKYLYAGFRCTEPEIAKIRCNQLTRDLYVWRDDCVELFYDGTNSHRDYKHLIVNAAGTVADFESLNGKENIKWNCSGLKTAAKKGKDCWCCEIAIPLSEFPSAVAGINFQRGRNNPGLSHAMLTKRANNPRNFAKIFTGKLPQIRLGVPEHALLGRNMGKLLAPESGTLTVTVNGVQKTNLPFEANKELTFPVDYLKPGVNQTLLSVKTAKGGADWHYTETLPEALFVGRTPEYLLADEPNLIISGKVNVRLAQGGDAKLAVKLQNGEGKELYAAKIPVTGNDFSFDIPVKGFLSSDHTYKAEIELLLQNRPAGNAGRMFYVMRSMEQSK